MSIDQKFDAQIDASLGFKQFNGQDNKSDGVKYTIANKFSSFVIPATASKMQLDIVADQNLSTYKISETNSSNTHINSIKLGDYNLTASATGADVNSTFTDAVTSTLQTDQTGAMSVTNFKATGFVTFNGFTKKLLNQVDAGAWTIYGYTAQIPNVVGLSNIDTTMKFTNRSSLDTNIYFTLIDPDGTVVTLDSVKNPSIASLPKKSTGTYKASDLLALVTDPDFDKTGSFSVEVSIPTTPSSVYGMASFKNKTLRQFKDLPIYNSSKLAY